METIDDIVREWRTNCDSSEADADHLGVDCVFDVSEVRDLLDRIEKSYKSLEAEKSRIIAELNNVRELNRKCCDENERLHAALQPVLGIVMDSATSDLSMEMAINEAQRIWKEGE